MLEIRGFTVSVAGAELQLASLQYADVYVQLRCGEMPLLGPDIVIHTDAMG